MRQRDYVFGRLGVHQHFGLRVFLHQGLQLKRFELVVDYAGALPKNHIGTGFTLYVAAQVFIRGPKNFLTAVFQSAHDIQRATTGDDPICTCFNRGAGIGVDHYRAVGMGVTKGVEFSDRAAQV